MEIQVYKTTYSSLWLREDGIIHMEPIPDSILNYEGALEEFEIIKKLCGNRKRPVLNILPHVKYADKKGRDFYAKSDEAFHYISAAAIVPKSPVARLIGNFMLGLNKPRYPLKIFNTKEEAVCWLRRFI